MEQGLGRSPLLGENIRKHRLRHHLTQEQMCAKLQILGCDISRGTFAKVEAGIRHISVDELEAIRAVLELDYKDLFMKSPQ